MYSQGFEIASRLGLEFALIKQFISLLFIWLAKCWPREAVYFQGKREIGVTEIWSVVWLSVMQVLSFLVCDTGIRIFSPGSYEN